MNLFIYGISPEMNGPTFKLWAIHMMLEDIQSQIKRTHSISHEFSFCFGSYMDMYIFGSRSMQTTYLPLIIG